MGAGKKVLLGIGIFFLLAIIGVFFVYKSLTGSSIVTAQAIPESGSVLVNSNQITANSIIKQGDVIETGADGLATVILYESVLVSLEPNTKITLDDLTKEHPQISQESGETWSKFTKLSGVEEYSVKTGNSVASVRGTAFGISSNKLIVGEGNVEYKAEGETFEAGENEVVAQEAGKRIKRMANADDLAKIRKGTERSIERMKKLREAEFARNKFIVNKIKSSSGMTDDDIAQFFNDVDDGKVDIDEMVRKSPVKVEGLTKIAEMSKKIREEKLRLLRLQNITR